MSGTCTWETFKPSKSSAVAPDGHADCQPESYTGDVNTPAVADPRQRTSPADESECFGSASNPTARAVFRSASNCVLVVVAFVDRATRDNRRSARFVSGNVACHAPPENVGVYVTLRSE